MKVFTCLSYSVALVIYLLLLPSILPASVGWPALKETIEKTPTSVVTLRAWYVNDTWTSSDVFTTATGNDISGNGSASAPYATIAQAVFAASPGDTIFVDGGYFAMSPLFLSKQVKIFGANWNINPNTSNWALNPGRNAETVLAPNGNTFSMLIFGDSNTEIRGLRFQQTLTNSLVFLVNNSTGPTLSNITIVNNIFSNASNYPSININHANNPINNVLISQNRFEQCAARTISMSGIYGVQISRNYFANITASEAVYLQNIRSTLSFSENRIINTSRTGLAITNLPSGLSSATITNNDFSACNTSGEDIRGAINVGLQWNTSMAAGFESVLQITQNNIANSTNGVVVAGQASSIGNIVVNRNSIVASAGFSIKNYSPGTAGTLNATCNWFGQLCAIESRINNVQTSGSIQYNPRLLNGTDSNIAIGFQPAASACPSNMQLVDAGNYGPACRNDVDIALFGLPAGGTWSGTGLAMTNGITTFDPGVGTQTLTYSGLDGYGCTSVDMVTITVYDNPAPPILTGSTVCSASAGGGQVNISTSVSGQSYQLFNDSHQAIQPAQQGTGGVLTWTGLQAGTGYYVNVINGNGCSNLSNPAGVQVYQMFSPGAIAGSGQQICYFESPSAIENLVSASGGNAPITYKWQSSSSSDFSNASDLPNSNTPGYHPPTTPGTSTFFRRLAKDETCSAFVPSSGVWEVEINSGEPISSGRVLNKNTGHAFCYVQSAVDHASTLNGHVIELGGGNFPENIHSGSKELTFVLDETPTCAEIQGDFTLSSSATLSMKIEEVTPCGGHDRISVTGTLTIEGATLVIPPSSFLPSPEMEIMLVEVLGSSPVTGYFANNIVGNGLVSYQVHYDGGDGNDIVLRRYLGSALGMGIFSYTGNEAEAHKLQVKLRPEEQIQQGVYTAGVFTIRSPSVHNVVFNYFGAPASPIQYVQVGNKLSHEGFDYFFFQYEAVQTINWNAGVEYPVLTLGYDCSIGNATFELINNDFTASKNGNFYQELWGVEVQGIFYEPVATGPPAFTVTSTINTPVCENMALNLRISVQGGTPGYTTSWSGPDMFETTLPQVSLTANAQQEGFFRYSASDANSCKVLDSIYVEVLDAEDCVENQQTGYLYPTIGAAIDSVQTLDGHTLLVPARVFQEEVVVSKALHIKGVHADIPCGDPSRSSPESRISAPSGTAVNVASHGVTIQGLQIEGKIGVFTDDFDHFSAVNNHILSEEAGIVVSSLSTSAGQALVISDNCVELQYQVSPAMVPSVGIACSGISGSHAAVLQRNHIEGAFYGYRIFGLDTDATTVIREGTMVDVMQGVAIFNTLQGVADLPTSLGVEDLSFTSFVGHHPDLGNNNFRAGIYVHTAGTDTTATVELHIQSVEVSHTGSHSVGNAGMAFVDESSGIRKRLSVTLDACLVRQNANCGIRISGENALLQVLRSELTENGADPFSSVGYGILAEDGAIVELRQNFLSNPPSQLSNSVVTIGVGSTPASVEATHNHFSRNGNGKLVFTPHTAPAVEAACNWWGSSGIEETDRFSEGHIDFIPFLGAGVDMDTEVAGFQPEISTCIFPGTWYVNDASTDHDVFADGAGDDSFQGTLRRPFRTLGRALETASRGDTILIDVGVYDEQVVIPASRNGMHLIGAGAFVNDVATVLDFSGITQGKPAILDIAADSITLDGLQFRVDLSILNSAIIASDPELDTIALINLYIEPYETVPGVSLGASEEQVAVCVNCGTYRRAFGGMKGILFDQNTVSAQVSGEVLHEGTGAVGFRYALAVDEASGTIYRNTLQAFSRDLWIRNPREGDLRIGGSEATGNIFLGGGVLIEEVMSAFNGAFLEHNRFVGAGTTPTRAMLTLRDNLSDVHFRLANNELEQVRWGLSLENFRNVEVEANRFEPRSGFQEFRLMTINTKSMRVGTPLNQVPVSASLRGNTFESLFPGVSGVALACYNHNSQSAVFGTIEIGTPSMPNTFAKGFEHLILLADNSGSTLTPANLAEFPEYALGEYSDTPMGCWERGMDIRYNNFEMQTGTFLPSAMGLAETNALEDLLYHDLDHACLGLLWYSNPLELEARVFLQGPYDAGPGKMNDQLRTLDAFPKETPYPSIHEEFSEVFEGVNNFGKEEIAPSVLSTTGNNAIVDWVWLELRDKADPGLVLATRSALLQADGDIVDTDGISPVVFWESKPEAYYVAVSHRNHLGAMTAAPVDLSGSPVVDFTDPMLFTAGTTPVSARKLLSFGVLGLIAGNAIPSSPDGVEVKYHGEYNDRVAILNAVGQNTPLNTLSSVYRLEDLNLDGAVKYNGSGNDRLVILNNVGIFTPLNTIVQESGN